MYVILFVSLFASGDWKEELGSIFQNEPNTLRFGLEKVKSLQIYILLSKKLFCNILTVKTVFSYLQSNFDQIWWVDTVRRADQDYLATSSLH